MAAIRIGICGPHRLVRQGLASALAGAPDIEVVAVKRAPAAVRVAVPDVVVAFVAHGAARATVKELSPVPSVLVTAEAMVSEGQVAVCHEDTRVGRIEQAIRSLVARHPDVVTLTAIEGERPTETLSDRELQVLRLVARGLTAEEIATRLSLSPRTVANHKARVFAKLGVQSQSHAVAAAVRDGLLVPEGPRQAKKH